MRRAWMLVLAVGLLWPATASAGTYDVVACNAPGAGGVNNSWAGQATGFNERSSRAAELRDRRRLPRRASRVWSRARSGSAAASAAGFLTGAAWSFVAPGGHARSRA